jgi:hypothetical protein
MAGASSVVLVTLRNDIDDIRRLWDSIDRSMPT